MEDFCCYYYFVVLGEIMQCVVDNFFVVVVGVVVGGIKKVNVVFKGVFDDGMVVFFGKCSGVIVVIWFVECYIVQIKVGYLKICIF